MMKNVFSVALAGWLTAQLLVGCGGPNQEEVGHPKKLVVGLVVADNAEQTFEHLDVVDRYFTRKLGMEVHFYKITDASSLIEAIRAKKVHVGFAGAFTYLIAAQKANVEAIITTAAANGDPKFYQSCFITHPNSGIKTINDLLTRSKEITLSWAYPTSTSGHLVPRYFLQQKGLMPEDFKEVVTSTDHTATILTVLSRKVDVAAMTYVTLDRFIRTGKIKKDDVRVLWMSDPIAPSPTFVRKDLDEGLKKRIQQAYLTMQRDDPEAREALRTQFIFEVKYIPVVDSLYQPLRDMANRVEGLQLEEK
ncbi:MAG: phosphate/phosphite/phosphonate ABC transporter substrate-binding protein [Ferruginibacter sp.]|nr:phosphate/phosphite/phosphonate ABC transporter substrate-binding protein [Cytophagales bacterium]